jgi:hypothetical protein
MNTRARQAPPIYAANCSGLGHDRDIGRSQGIGRSRGFGSVVVVLAVVDEARPTEDIVKIVHVDCLLQKKKSVVLTLPMVPSALDAQRNASYQLGKCFLY